MSPVASYVVQTVVTLVGVVALAVVFLYGARRAGMGRPSGPLELVGRLPLDGRRVIYLVRAGATVHVVGASETGLVKLGEMPESALTATPSDVASPSLANAPASETETASRPTRDGVNGE